jgi:hypothetical protein
MSDLGPQPEPTTEEPELVPGGADAVEPDEDDNGLGRDLDPDDNPAVEDALPDEIAAPDDKQQEPSGDRAEDAEAGTEAPEGDSEPAAGQEDEEGGVEPPA